MTTITGGPPPPSAPYPEEEAEDIHGERSRPVLSAGWRHARDARARAFLRLGMPMFRRARGGGRRQPPDVKEGDLVKRRPAVDGEHLTLSDAAAAARRRPERRRAAATAAARRGGGASRGGAASPPAHGHAGRRRGRAACFGARQRGWGDGESRRGWRARWGRRTFAHRASSADAPGLGAGHRRARPPMTLAGRTVVEVPPPPPPPRATGRHARDVRIRRRRLETPLMKRVILCETMCSPFSRVRLFFSS